MVSGCAMEKRQKCMAGGKGQDERSNKCDEGVSRYLITEIRSRWCSARVKAHVGIKANERADSKSR